MAEARRVETTHHDHPQPAANNNRPPLRVVQGGREMRIDSTRNASTQTKSTNADRNVKKTYQAPRGQQDIATQFRDSYSEKGLQPLGLVDEAGEAAPRPQYEQPAQITRSKQAEQRRQGLVKRGTKTFNRRSKFKKRSIAGRAFTKTRVTAVNAWVWSWGLWSWALFQLPFAILSLAFLAIHETLHQLFTDLTVAKADDNLAQATIKAVGEEFSNLLSTIGQVINWVAETAWSIDLSFFSPVNFFILTYLVVMMFGWFTLMLTYFMYKGTFLRPLSGRGSTFKITTFLLALIGYALPIFNVFPWFVFWTMAVWWYPK